MSDAPDLSGHDVTFARYDPTTGKITSTGVMHREHILTEYAQGVSIIEVESPMGHLTHKVDVATKKPVILSTPLPGTPICPSMDVVIQFELMRTDHYFTGDALDNITAQEQQDWRIYRKALRVAAKLGDDKSKLAALPKDAKGVDQFAVFR